MKTEVKNIDFSVYNLSNLSTKKKEINEAKVRKHFLNQDIKENTNLLFTCSEYWSSLQDFRDRRERARKYLRGQQWHELISNPDNETEIITEEQYIRNQGKIPFKQNIIRQMIKNIIGQYRSNPTKTIVITRNREDQREGEIMSQVLRAAKDLNRSEKLDTRNWEEFLLSGAAVQKIGYQHWDDRDQEDLFIENINITRMFFNNDISDVRLLDLNLIGELRDCDIDELISVFAQNDDEAEIIRGWYQNPDRDTQLVQYEGLTAQRIEDLDFLIGPDDKCRIIEVWEKRAEFRLYYHDYLTAEVGYTKRSKEELALINEARLAEGIAQGMSPEYIPLIDYWNKLDRFWYVKMLTPFGQCLYEGETPYTHKSHPYVMLLYPLLDGEVWGLIEDIIDQQRYINRLISLMDFIMGASAKGVLFIHEDNIPKGMSIDDFAVEWTKFNGVIKYKAKPGTPAPKQVHSNSTNIGIMEMLNLQMKLVQDISGVSSAIQGQTAKSGTPSSLYSQEAQNSLLNIKDHMDEYSEFKRDRDMKALKTVIQFYNEERVITVPGTRKSFVQYSPQDMKDLNFDVAVSQTSDTPVYRQLVDEALWKLFEAQMIDIKMYLENSSLPFADKLLNDIKQREQQQMGQDNVPVELANQIAAMAQQTPESEKTAALLERLSQAQ